MTTFWETMLLPTLKRQDFVQKIMHCAKYGPDTIPDLDTERNPNDTFPEPEPQNNRYGSTTPYVPNDRLPISTIESVFLI